MTRFAHVLQRADRTLRAPEPQRSRVLLELAQDLDDLFGELRAGGLTEAEAVRRAEALMAPSPEAIEALCALHAPLHVRLAERFSEGSGHRFELLLLIGATLLSLGSAAFVLLGTSSSLTTSPAAWLLALILTCLAWQGAALLLQVPAVLHAGDAATSRMTSILWLAGLASAVGVSGALVEIWLLTGRAQAGGANAGEVFAAVGRAADLLVFALALVLATLLIWFAAYRRSRRAAMYSTEITREEAA